MPHRWIITPSFFEHPEPALLGIAPLDAALNPASASDRTAQNMARLHAPIRQFTFDQINAGHRPVSLAGDCCAALPVLAGLQQSGITPTLVWLDAHADFNTPATSPSGFLGGMPLAMITGRGPQWLCEANRLTPLADKNIILVDARDLDPLEGVALATSNIRHIDTAAFASLAVSGPVHLHFDTDILNAAACDAFNYQVAGGPMPDALTTALAAFARHNHIAALSISGWTGALEQNRNAQIIFADILAPFGAKLRPI